MKKFKNRQTGDWGNALVKEIVERELANLPRKKKQEGQSITLRELLEGGKTSRGTHFSLSVRQ